MTESDEISRLQNELAHQRSQLAALHASNASAQEIAQIRRAIADCKDALHGKGIAVDDSADESELTGNRQHLLMIAENAQVAIAISGDVNAPISYQTNLHISKRLPIDSEEAMLRLAELPEDAIPPEGDLPAGSWMQPRRTSNFIGRKSDLLTLARYLKQGGVSLITTGMGGVGKSTLASEFAYRYGHYFLGGVYWLSFDDPSAIDSQIAACGGYDAMQVYHESEQLTLEQRCARVQAAWNEPIPRLVIFDNWDQVGERQARQLLQRYLPKGSGCRVLITSRNSEWPSHQALHRVPLGLLSRLESIALLQSYRVDLNEHDADTIAEELGDLPLALTLAGRFLERYQEQAFGVPQIYLSNLRNKLLDHRSLTDADRSVRVTFAMSYERLQVADEIDDLAITALAHAAYFAPNEPIPQTLLQSSCGATDPGNEEQGLLHADAIKRLFQLGLVEQASEGWLRIHRLIARYVQETMNDSEAQEWVENLVMLNSAYYAEQSHPAGFTWLMPHLRHCYQARTTTNHIRSAEFANALGCAEQEQINYSVAEPLFQYALTILERDLGIDHPTTITTMSNLANLYYLQGRYGEAEDLYLHILSLRAKLLDANHPNIANILNNLANLYHLQGRYEEAEPLFVRAYTILEEHLGPDDYITTISLNSLARLYQAQGRYEEAEPLFQEILTIRQDLLGLEHPDTATSLNNLANLYQVQGRYREAEPLFQQALAIILEQMSIKHPETATSLNNLAALYYVQARYEEAEPLFQQALITRQELLGSTHPDTATSLHNLAALYQAQERYEYAEPLFQQALTIRKTLLGLDHPDTASSLSNLAYLYQEQKRYEQAESLYLQALSIREQLLGSEHVDTINSQHNLASLFQDQGKYEEAEQLYQQVLTTIIKNLGIYHHLAAITINNLAHLSLQQNKYHQAEGLFKLALLIYEQSLGTDHPSIHNARNVLVLSQQLASVFTQAEQEVAQALTNPTDDHTPLLQRLEEIARQFETDKTSLAFATALRELAAKLQPRPKT
jgi:tetratricopeptide (TPR) repeat protein/ribosomal protein L29